MSSHSSRSFDFSDFGRDQHIQGIIKEALYLKHTLILKELDDLVKRKILVLTESEAPSLLARLDGSGFTIGHSMHIDLHPDLKQRIEKLEQFEEFLKK